MGNQPAAGRQGNDQEQQWDRIDEADPEANPVQPAGGPQRAQNRAQEESKAQQPKNKKKVHTIKNQSNIKKDTIKLRKVHQQDNSKYALDLVFDANYECIITVYICAKECRNAASIPLYFFTQPTMPKPCAYKFSSGLKQKMPQNLCIIDTSVYNEGPDGTLGCRKDDLVNNTEYFYPIVISIETIYPSGYKGKGRKNIQFTYGTFLKDSTTYRYKFLKQKLLYNSQIMDLNDIYGIDNMTANLADESQKECVVCYSTSKDTVVLPCRHMCLCIDCSQIVRMQTNKCPICRTQVSSFLHIKYDVNLPNQNAQNQVANN